MKHNFYHVPSSMELIKKSAVTLPGVSDKGGVWSSWVARCRERAPEMFISVQVAFLG